MNVQHVERIAAFTRLRLVLERWKVARRDEEQKKTEDDDGADKKAPARRVG